MSESPEDEIARLRAELAAAKRLAACATEYRVPVPERGGIELIVRRERTRREPGWAVGTMARGGGRSWTQLGWCDAVDAMSVDQLFCWPDAETAISECRRALEARKLV